MPLTANIGSNNTCGRRRRHTEKISALAAGQGLNPARRNCRRHTSKIGFLTSSPSGLRQASHRQLGSLHLLGFGRSETRCLMRDWQNSSKSPLVSSLHSCRLRFSKSAPQVGQCGLPLYPQISQHVCAKLNKDCISQNRLTVNGTPAWDGNRCVRKRRGDVTP